MSILGLDIGTTTVKATIFGTDGTIQGYAIHEYGYTAPYRYWAEQDPSMVWESTCTVIINALDIQKPKEPVSALCLSVQGEAIFPVNSAGKPLYQAMLGMDMRAEDECDLLRDKFGDERLYSISGMPPHPLVSISKLIWFKKHKPEIAKEAHQYLLYEDFILLKLGGEAFISYSMASRTMAFDIHSWQWDEEILALADINSKQMASPLPSGQVVGQIKPEIADKFGLRRDTLLVTGGHDVSCAVLGAGVIRPDCAVDIIGTAELLAFPVSSFDMGHSLRMLNQCCYPFLNTGLFLTYTSNQSAGVALRWFIENFAREQMVKAEKLKVSVYELIIENSYDKPSSVLFLPHLVGSGTPWLDAKSKGGFFGLTLSTTSEEVVKSILDCLVYELKISVERLEEAGISLSEIKAVGGGARSPKWLEIRSNILNKPIITLQVREGSCLGAAILAGTATGVYRSLEDGINKTVKSSTRYEPDQDQNQLYSEKYEVYKELYHSVADLNHKL